MTGQPLEEFTTLMESQGPAWMTDAETMINETVRHTYTGNRIAAQSGWEDMIQGGDYITDRIFLEGASDFRRYNPNDTFDHSIPQTGTEWSAPWAYATASISWTKQELGHNIHAMGKRYRAQKYKSVMRQKHQNLATGVCNGLEDEFWAPPYYDLMEASSIPVTEKRQPYSIPCFVNEFPNGLMIKEVDAGGGKGGSADWDTVQQIAPSGSTDPLGNWVPYAVGGGALSVGASDTTQGYTFDASTGTPADTASIFDAFERAYWNLRFDRLPKNPKYSDKTSSPQVIWSSIQGIVDYEHALRANQDHFRGVGKTSGQDPAYDGPTFRRMPLEVISGLGTALLYYDSVVPVDELNRTASGAAGNVNGQAGPRYYWMNTEYLRFIAHEQNYCVLEEPQRDRSQPFTYTQQMDLWNQNVVRSRKRLGIVGPKYGSTYSGA